MRKDGLKNWGVIIHGGVLLAYGTLQGWYWDNSIYNIGEGFG